MTTYERNEVVKRGVMGVLGISLVAVATACAGMNHEPQSPEETPSEALATEEPQPSEPTSEEQSAESPDQGATQSASSEDLQQALQVVIQDEALLSELKLGEPGRFPLKISGSEVESGLKLQAHTEAVEVVGQQVDAKTNPVLVFTEIDLNAKQGTFKYRYEIEGVRGTSHVFKNEAGVWELQSSRVTGY